MASLKRGHLRIPPPVSSDDDISNKSDAMEEDPEAVTGNGMVESDTSRSLTDSSGIKGTPNRPSVSSFKIDRTRWDIAGEDSVVKPKRSLNRSSSKRLPESGLNKGKMKKKTNKKLPFSTAVATLTPADEEIGEEKRKSVGRNERIWDEEDEVAILKGVHEFRAKTGFDPSADWSGFSNFIKDSIKLKPSRNQLKDKIRQLKKKFNTTSEKLSNVADLALTESHEAIVFELSKKIWGKAESNEDMLNNCNANGNKKEVREMRRNKKIADSAEPETVTENALILGLPEQADAAVAAAATDNAGETMPIPEGTEDRNVVITEKGRSGKESSGNNDADALHPYLLEALEAMVEQRVLGKLEKEMLIEESRFSGCDTIKEAANEWKAYRLEEMTLNCKRLKLLNKFAKGAQDALKNM